MQHALNMHYERMRAAEHALRGPFNLLERRHGLAEIVERGAGVSATGHSHHLTFTALTDARLLVISKARLDALPATAMLAVARVVMVRSSHEYRHHTAVVANLMQ